MRAAHVALLIAAGLCVNPVVARADNPAPQFPGSALLGELNKDFDLDHDGRLDPQERQAAQAAMLERFDANGNGRLDPAEMRGLARQFKPDKGKPQTASPAEQSGSAASTEPGTSPLSKLATGLSPDCLDRFDRNADGRLSAGELSAARKDAALKRAVAATLLRFDADGDGHLNAAERHAARSALARLRAPPAKSQPDAETLAPPESLVDEKP